MKITGVKPWLVRVGTRNWGEYLFVEVNTDEGITGWGEITTTTKVANRALATIVRQLNDLGRRGGPGAASSASGTKYSAPLPIWDLGGRRARRSAGLTSHYGTSGARPWAFPSMSCSAARCVMTFPSTAIPTRASSTRRRTLYKEIRAIVDSGHTAFKFDPFPHSEEEGFERANLY